MSEKQTPTPPPGKRPVPTEPTQDQARAAILEGERLARAQARVGQAVRGSHEQS